jgi:hypothetical protein
MHPTGPAGNRLEALDSKTVLKAAAGAAAQSEKVLRGVRAPEAPVALIVAPVARAAACSSASQ